MERLVIYLVSLALLLAGLVFLLVLDGSVIWRVAGIVLCLGSAALMGAYLGLIAKGK